MSDTVEKLIMDFWSVHMDGLLPVASVFAREPQSETQDPPYLCVDTDVNRGRRTNTGGYQECDITFELFHRNWRTGLNIVSELKRTLSAVSSLAGDEILVDNFYLESGMDDQLDDQVWQFTHTYSCRVHDMGA